jgi:RNA polymerase sigma-70 factor (ECF subfamily)
MAFTTIHINPTDLLEQPVQLIQACINGDRHSQSSLYAQYALKMFGVCMRYSKNREEAEEIMQEGFVQVFKSLHNFKYAGSFEGWIRKIMVYCAIQHYRAKPKMHSVVNIENSQAIEIGDEDIITGLQKKELLKMIQALPPTYRMIFNLYVFEGMKHREIAELLGIAEGTSKSNFFDAKLLLQKAVTSSLKIAKSY